MKKKVALITTGGTIASKLNERNKLESGKLSGEDILSICQLKDELEIVLIDLFRIPSMHMTFDNLNYLNKTIHEVFDDKSISGIVITHGTDSLEETAYFLELTINDDRPVIVTGSQKSPSDIGSDVYYNLRNSLLVASSDYATGIGTCVVFNEKILHSKYAKKVHSSNINGFDTIGYGMLGYIDNDEVIIYQKPTRHEQFEIKESYPYVEIIHSCLGSNSILLDSLLNVGIDGLIIVGAGRGQVSPMMVKSIEKLRSKGVEIVLTTSTDGGRVYPTYDYYGSANYLKNIGVIMGGDFDVKKARIKLMLCLANNSLKENSFLI